MAFLLSRSCQRLIFTVSRPTGKKLILQDETKSRKLKDLICNVVQKRTSTTATVAVEKEVPRVVGWWLGGIAGMAFGAVAIGGLTRLTESGLSMVDWSLFGRRPPANSEEWEIEFEKYKKSPEFLLKNSEISLEDFKFIWHMEYGHRMWGRSIGAFFYIPAAYFWFKGHLNSAIKKRVVVAGALLACQGLLGWYMVKSGLDHKNFEGPSDVPRVSQYRLASHLSTAMVLYSVLLWTSMDVLMPTQKPAFSGAILSSIKKLRGMTMGVKAFVFLTAVSGAFVAGLDAGLTYNTFPKMADRWLPTDLFALSPWLSNFTENPTTVQFDHRIFGTLTLGLITMVAIKSRGVPLPGRGKAAVLALLGMGYMQVCLGIATLLNHVPTSLASMHQCGALLTLSSALWLSHELKLSKALKYVPK